MQIKAAGQCGFCFGVKRAINIAEKTLLGSNRRDSIYSLGPVIHNPQVVDELFKKGLKVIHNIDSLRKGTVIISSHGAPKDLIMKIKMRKLRLIDATCPFVKQAQDIVKDLRKQGYRIIIVGDKQHPEIKSLLSLAGSQNRSRKIGVVSQTTQSKTNYLKEIRDILSSDFSEIRIFNTICNDTSRRQELARRLLRECDIMFIAGGKNSANTKRLYQICKESGVDSYHIETEFEIKTEFFNGKKCVGIVSGASTPASMVRKVAKMIRKLTNSD